MVDSLKVEKPIGEEKRIEKKCFLFLYLCNLKFVLSKEYDVIKIVSFSVV